VRAFLISSNVCERLQFFTGEVGDLREHLASEVEKMAVTAQAIRRECTHH